MIVLKIILALLGLILIAGIWIMFGLMIVWFMEDIICGFRGYFERFCLKRFLKRSFGTVFWPLWLLIGWFCYKNGR